MKYNKKNSFLTNIGIILIAVVLSTFFYTSISASKNSSIKNQNKLKQENQSEQKQNIKNQAVYTFAPVNIPFHPNLPPFAMYKYIYSYKISVLSDVKNVEILIPIPNNEKERQYISDFIINPKPNAFVKIKGNLVAKYKIPELRAGEYDIIISGTAQVRTYNIKNAKKLNQNITPETDVTQYLLPEKAIESDDPYIISIAQEIKGETKEEIVENVYKYIQNNMSYQLTETLSGAKHALMHRIGKCGEYAAIMVALLRAKNIPARIAIGNIAREYNPSHNWVEVYYSEYGWVTYDPTVAPTIVKIHAPNGRLIKIEKRYDVSHDNLHYIQSGINAFSPYFLRYSDEYQEETVSINQDISIIRMD